MTTQTLPCGNKLPVHFQDGIWRFAHNQKVVAPDICQAFMLRPYNDMDQHRAWFDQPGFKMQAWTWYGSHETWRYNGYTDDDGKTWHDCYETDYDLVYNGIPCYIWRIGENGEEVVRVIH